MQQLTIQLTCTVLYALFMADPRGYWKPSDQKLTTGSSYKSQQQRTHLTTTTNPHAK